MSSAKFIFFSTFNILKQASVVKIRNNYMVGALEEEGEESVFINVGLGILSKVVEREYISLSDVKECSWWKGKKI